MLIDILTFLFLTVKFFQVDGNDNYAETSGPNSLRNELEDKIDHTNRELEMLREQQLTFLNLQQKADTKLRDARQIQDKLMGQCNFYMFF